MNIRVMFLKVLENMFYLKRFVIKYYILYLIVSFRILLKLQLETKRTYIEENSFSAPYKIVSNDINKDY